MMPGRARGPASSERRVVAVVLFDLGGARLDADVDATLREVLGEDTRLEPLLGGQHGRGARRRALPGRRGRCARRAPRSRSRKPSPPRASPSRSATRSAAARTSPARRSSAPRGSSSSRRPGTVRVDTHAASALEGRFVLQDDARGGVLLARGRERVRRAPAPRTPHADGRSRRRRSRCSRASTASSSRTRRRARALVTGPPASARAACAASSMQRLEIGRRPPGRPALPRRSDEPRLEPLGARPRAARAHGRARRRSAVGAGPQGQAPRRARACRRTLRFSRGFLGELIGVPFPDEADEPLRAARASAQLMQSRLRMALEAYVRAQADRAPQVLIIEDVHWADDTTLELVDWLLGCPDLRFGVFAFAAPEVTARACRSLWDRRNVTRLTLSPALAARRRSPRRRRAAERGRGDARQASCGARAATRSSSRSSCAAPPKAATSCRSRCRRSCSSASIACRPQVREVLRAAAVFGQSFWTGGVDALLGRTVDARAGRARADRDHHAAARVAHRRPRRVDLPTGAGARRRLRVHPRGGSRRPAPRRGRLARVRRRRRRRPHRAPRRRRRRPTTAPRASTRAPRDRPTRTARSSRPRSSSPTAASPAAPRAACERSSCIAKAQVSIFMGRLLDGIAAAEEAAELAPPARTCGAKPSASRPPR